MAPEAVVGGEQWSSRPVLVGPVVELHDRRITAPWVRTRSGRSITTVELPHHAGDGHRARRVIEQDGHRHSTPTGRPAPTAAVLDAGDGLDWTGVTTAPLPLAEAAAWAVRPGSGALVVFAGTVRDHAEGRPGVTLLEYEAYEEQAEVRLAKVASEARSRWPALGRLVLLHRLGALEPTEISVLVVAAAPHRSEAFEGARWCIDTVKATVPVWKREHWDGGVDWGTCASDVEAVPPHASGPSDVPGPVGGR